MFFGNRQFGMARSASWARSNAYRAFNCLFLPDVAPGVPASTMKTVLLPLCDRYLMGSLWLTVAPVARDFVARCCPYRVPGV